MTENLHEIAEQAVEARRWLRDGDLVIDVGCNDGTLLDRIRLSHPTASTLSAWTLRT